MRCNPVHLPVSQLQVLLNYRTKQSERDRLAFFTGRAFHEDWQNLTRVTCTLGTELP